MRSLPFVGVRVLAGFDAFVDNIVHVVAERTDHLNYTAMESIPEFFRVIQGAAGKSANLELVRQQQKAGGNAPLFAICSAALGAKVSAVVPVGIGAVMPVFKDAGPEVEWMSIGEPGNTDALEFRDGKLMLGNIGDVAEIGWDRICTSIGEGPFFALLEQSDLVMLGNWTMLMGMGTIFEALTLRLESHPAKAMFFLDLADPKKRSREDLRHALGQICRLAVQSRTVLGLNRSEAEQVLEALSIGQECSESHTDLQNAARVLCGKLGIHGVVIHTTRMAGACLDGMARCVDGPFCSQPFLTTGAGDHFNGGFATALGAGMDLEQALLCGVASSGFYVRQGRSATSEELADFIKSWQENTLSL